MALHVLAYNLKGDEYFRTRTIDGRNAGLRALAHIYLTGNKVIRSPYRPDNRLSTTENDQINILQENVGARSLKKMTLDVMTQPRPDAEVAAPFKTTVSSPISRLLVASCPNQ